MQPYRISIFVKQPRHLFSRKPNAITFKSNGNFDVVVGLIYFYLRIHAIVIPKLHKNPKTTKAKNCCGGSCDRR